MGVDHKKMNLLLAILEKKYHKPFGFHDVFIKTAAAINIDEPASDLAICMALVSSLENRTLNSRTVYLGEVGLNGEVRSVNSVKERIKEAEKLGFEKVVLPRTKNELKNLSLKLHFIERLEDIFENDSDFYEKLA